MRLCMTFEKDNVTYIRNEKQMGACATRNREADAGRGEYIAFLDDDFWRSNKISKQVSVLEKYLEYEMIYSDFTLFNENNGKTIKYSDGNKPHSGNVFDDFEGKQFFHSNINSLYSRR